MDCALIVSARGHDSLTLQYHSGPGIDTENRLCRPRIDDISGEPPLFGSYILLYSPFFGFLERKSQVVSICTSAGELDIALVNESGPRYLWDLENGLSTGQCRSASQEKIGKKRCANERETRAYGKVDTETFSIVRKNSSSLSGLSLSPALYALPQEDDRMKKMRLVKGVPRDEEGDMGIGTLIIFIALVLVAAVAASVIVSTAYVLQQQAQDTADQAIAEVSTGFRIVDIFGNRLNQTNNAIQIVFVKLGLMSGSSPINFEDVVIEIDDGFTETNLVFGLTANMTNYNVSTLRDKEPINTPGEHFVTSGDLLMVRLNVSEIGLNLLPQTQVIMKIIPKHGIPNYERFTTPSAYTNVIIDLV